MILPDNIHPENTLYYNGAQILKVLSEYEHPTCNVFELYNSCAKTLNIDIQLYSLSLDWLFLLNLITFNSKGDITICS